MSKPSRLHIALLSETTFGSSEQTEGIVDTEVAHDRFGIPLVSGKTIKGLLRDTWLSMAEHFPKLQNAALEIFGKEADYNQKTILWIGDASIPEEDRIIIEHAVQRKDDPLSPHIILEGFSDIRKQTSINRATGAPEEASLRSVRVLLAGLTLEAPLEWIEEPKPEHLQCLALAAAATRHAGLTRNRGRGHIRIGFDGDAQLIADLAQSKE